MQPTPSNVLYRIKIHGILHGNNYFIIARLQDNARTIALQIEQLSKIICRIDPPCGYTLTFYTLLERDNFINATYVFLLTDAFVSTVDIAIQSSFEFSIAFHNHNSPSLRYLHASEPPNDYFLSPWGSLRSSRGGVGIRLLQTGNVLLTVSATA